MINVNNFKSGMTFEIKEGIFSVISSSHSKQGRGQASVKAKIKNLRTGAVLYKTWNGGNQVSKAHISKIKMNYLYNDGVNYFFMDNDTYEQIEIPIVKVKWEINFLIEGSNVLVRKFNEEILDIELPPKVSLSIKEVEDAIKGNSQNNPQKIAILETGYSVFVPIFIKNNEKIIISTETGLYIKRDNK